MNSRHFRRVAHYAEIVPEGLLIGTPERPLLLNGTGRRIWDALEYATSIAELADLLAADFAVSPDVAQQEAEGFVTKMCDAGLVTAALRSDPMRDRYFALLKRSLVNLIYADNEQRLWRLFDGKGQPPEQWPSHAEFRDLRYDDAESYARLVAAKQVGHVVHRQPGRYAHTMVGLHGLTHVERLVEHVFEAEVPGDFVDAGVWRGGCGVLMRAMQRAFGQADRRLWVADSFAGVPVASAEPDLRMNIDLSEAAYPWMSASIQSVRDTFAAYDLLDPDVRFLPGLFADTLPRAPIAAIALLRIDGDLYTSTMDCLAALYDRVSVGGYVIVDDYGAFSACREAVDGFRAARGITEPLVHANWTIVHWRKDG